VEDSRKVEKMDLETPVTPPTLSTDEMHFIIERYCYNNNDTLRGSVARSKGLGRDKCDTCCHSPRDLSVLASN
jgi:hypothetical protein